MATNECPSTSASAHRAPGDCEEGPSLALISANALAGAVIAGVFAVAPMPEVMLFVFVLPFVCLCAWRFYSRYRGRVRSLDDGAAVAAFTVVIAAAYFAPMKTQDIVLDRRVTLPKAELTLGELHDLAEMDRRQAFPIYVSLTTSEADNQESIKFSANEISLREFVASVESQSHLRSRFAHCGNGSTILWGGDCCFGLHFRNRP